MYRFILVLLLAAPIAHYAADSTQPTAASTPVVSTVDFETLKRAATQCKAALQTLGPVKAALIQKSEKLRAQEDASSDAMQFLIDANEKKLAKIITQERQIKQSLATIETRLAELRRDPEQGAMVEAEDQLKAATAQQEALLKGLPQVPTGNAK
jgi:DNA repair exonuclease SbcCD ATPase subunit